MPRTGLRKLAAVGGAVCAALLIAAPPAFAAPEAVSINMRDVTVAVGHTGVVVGANLISAEPGVLDDVVVTYDFSALAGLVEVVAPACTLTTPTILACARDQVRLGSAPLTGEFDVVVRAVDGAGVGDGPLQLGVQAAGLPLVSGSSWVRVGTGVDLVAGPSTEIGRRPGQSFTLPLTVEVAGATAVERPSVYFTQTHAFRATRKFTNCLYVEDRLRNCWFEGTFTPGATYSAVWPFLLGADTAAPGTRRTEATWLTAAEAADYESFLAGHGYSGGEPGTEGELSLTGEVGLRPMADQADTEPSNNRSTLTVTVTGYHDADLVAVGAAVRGAVGETRAVTVGVRNDGPAAAERPDGDVAVVDVTIPPGTTATAAAPECAPLFDPDALGVAGAAAYRCRPGPFVPAGFTVQFAFELRVDRSAPTEGSVRLVGADDSDTTNDRATITVNRAAAPAPGRLPITGAPAGSLAALGVLMIVAGVLMTRVRAA
ncbi:hypothetical protein SAMN05421812_11982 [Asanoa hainanensis]|uniref:Gram-positive cocci surface proteins LPxTG domain-containing protein n=1 Tax=Asanoa hainanensis TaxID=560556 RepID=A0A239PDA7_9ACTN|nr:hypothetical protein [Asanoa hainanensis]SNT65007.1 hypothetical protein SAMN05421812_11982 [Asanoa hainanensis]